MSEVVRPPRLPDRRGRRGRHPGLSSQLYAAGSADHQRRADRLRRPRDRGRPQRPGRRQGRRDRRPCATCSRPRPRAPWRAVKKRRRRPASRPPTTPCFHGLDGYKKLLAHAGRELRHPRHAAGLPAVSTWKRRSRPASTSSPRSRWPWTWPASASAWTWRRRRRTKELKIAAGTQRRHQAGYIETMKRMHDGRSGDILSGRVYWNGDTPWYPPAAEGHERTLEYQLHNWYHFLWLCGDHIVEQHVHNLDVANWALKANPVKATGMGGRSNRPRRRPEGRRPHLRPLRGRVRVPERRGRPELLPADRRLRRTTSPRTSSAPRAACTRSRATYIVNGKEIVGGAETDPYVQEHIDLIKAIRDDKPLNELEHVTNSTFTAILGRMSAYSGKTLKWDDVLHGVTASEAARKSTRSRGSRTRCRRTCPGHGSCRWTRSRSSARGSRSKRA